MRSMVTRIIVRRQKIELQLSKHAIMKIFLTPQQSEEIAGTPTPSEDIIILEADAQLRRCGGEVRLLLADIEQNGARPSPLWSELSHEHMTGWIGFYAGKYPISALWRNRLALMNATSAELSPWLF